MSVVRDHSGQFPVQYWEDVGPAVEQYLIGRVHVSDCFVIHTKLCFNQTE